MRNDPGVICGSMCYLFFHGKCIYGNFQNVCTTNQGWDFLAVEVPLSEVLGIFAYKF